MKNCMFIAKLYLLTLLTNILAKVTRGTDRQIHYVKTGLSTDVEGSVHSTIRAIKQNQVRYSDIGTINDIFNICGSMVDVFMPVSIDGERPIETETISGQNIDMDNDFLEDTIDFSKNIIEEVNKEPMETEASTIVNENNNINIFGNISDNETYATYKVYTVMDTDTIDGIISKYNISKELLGEYNNIEDIKSGDKLIIPSDEK